MKPAHTYPILANDEWRPMTWCELRAAVQPAITDTMLRHRLKRTKCLVALNQSVSDAAKASRMGGQIDIRRRG